MAESSVPEFIPSYEDLKAENVALRRQIEELEQQHPENLRRVTRIVNASLDRDLVLVKIVEQAYEQFGCDGAVIFLTSYTSLELAVVIGMGNVSIGDHIEIDRANSAVWIIQHRQPLIIDDIHTTTEWTVYPVASHLRSWMGVPLIVEGQSMGVLAIAHEVPGHYTAIDLARMQILADYASIALNNTRLFQVQRKQRELAESLHKVAQTINNSLDRSTVLHQVIHQLSRLASFADSAIFIFLTNGDMLVLSATNDSASEDHIGTQLLFSSDDPVVRTFLECQPMILDNVLYDPGWKPLPGNRMVRGWMGVPMFVGENVIGVLTVNNTVVGKYTAEDAQLLQIFANHAAIAIENARLFTEQQQQRQLAESLRRVAHIVNTSLDRDTVLEKIMEQLRKVFDHNGAAIFLADEEEQCMVMSATSGVRGPEFVGTRIPFDNNDPVIRVYKKHWPIFIPDLLEDSEWEMWPGGEQLRSWIGVPLQISDRTIGVLAADHFVVDRYDAYDALVLQAFASHATIAIENARLYQQVRMEQRLSEALVENMPVAIVMTDLEARVSSWSPAAERLFQYAAEEAVGERLIDLVANTLEIRQEAEDHDRRSLQGATIQHTTRRTRKDGSMVDIELLGVPVLLDGNRMGYITIFYDITELVRTRKAAEAANEAKSTFLANMSHELRTPLTAVIGMADLLRDTSLDTEQQEYAHTIRTSSDALLSLINDVLDFSKIEAGRMELEIRRFELRTCVEEAVEMVGIQAASKGLELMALFNASLPEWVMGDSTRLRQILVNLLSNAVKFTMQGEVAIEVYNGDALPAELHERIISLFPEKRDLLEITASPFLFMVRDTGIGIPKDRQGRLFQSFTQVDSSTTRAYGGTGLGLAISQRLARLMRGVIWMESQEGVGSTFYVLIDLQVPAESQTNSIYQLDLRLAGKKALLVDDNDTSRYYLQRQMERWGMHVTTFSSSLDVLTWTKQHPPCDVALLDRKMPTMDGIALAQVLRQNRILHSTALVLLDTLNQTQPLNGYAPFQGTITKPIKLNMLKAALLRVLDLPDANVIEQLAPVVDDDDNNQVKPPPNLRILLAEDNPVNQVVISRMLQNLGYTPDIVGTGAEVLAYLEQQPYDVVLMDVQMPVMDGVEATHRIRERYPSAQQPRIVALTAHAMPEDRTRYLDEGMDAYLSKPVQREKLDEILRNTPRLGERSTAQEAAVELDNSVIDWRVLDEYAEVFEDEQQQEEINDLIALFSRHSSQLLEELRQIASAPNYDVQRMSRAAHELGLSSDNVGAFGLAQQARKLEQLAMQQQLSKSDASSAVTQLSNMHARVTHMLNARQLQRRYSGAPK
ncbi:MAG: GAF domain-containing protein [Chloroflexaceae bacterium]|nr:GAF domain-containing protein [Chloroflexaceae bacterium]